MSLDSRIRELNDRHRKLEAAILSEQKRPSSDETRLHDLKRQKLKIKDELAQLRTG